MAQYYLTEDDRNKIAEALFQMGFSRQNKPPLSDRPSVSGSPEVYIVKGPIPAASNVCTSTSAAIKPGSATCDVYKVDSSGNLVKVEMPDGSQKQITVYNVFSCAIGSGFYIVIRTKFGKWVVVSTFDDCCSSSSSSGNPPPSSSSGSGSSSYSSSSSQQQECSETYTGDIYVGVGLARQGDNVCMSRAKLTFKNGVLCSVDSAQPQCVDVCDCGSSSSPPSSSGSQSPSSSNGSGSASGSGSSSSNCGYCTWQWSEPLQLWSPLVHQCDDNCECEPPSEDGSSDGEVKTTYCTPVSSGSGSQSPSSSGNPGSSSSQPGSSSQPPSSSNNPGSSSSGSMSTSTTSQSTSLGSSSGSVQTSSDGPSSSGSSSFSV